MDTGEGRFEEFEADNEEELNEKMKTLREKFTNHGGVFRVGEEIEIRGSLFRVQSIRPKKLILKLLKKG
jgi:hypothetical protein